MQQNCNNAAPGKKSTKTTRRRLVLQMLFWRLSNKSGRRGGQGKDLRKNYLVNVLAAGPAEQLTVNPPAKYILERGNVLVVMGSMEDLQRLPQK